MMPLRNGEVSNTPHTAAELHTIGLFDRNLVSRGSIGV